MYDDDMLKKHFSQFHCDLRIHRRFQVLQEASLTQKPGNLCPSCQTDHEANEVIDLQQLDSGANSDEIRWSYDLKQPVLDVFWIPG